MYQRTAVWEGHGVTARSRDVKWSSREAAVFFVVSKVIGWIIQICIYVDISRNGAKMYLSFSRFLFSILIVLKTCPDVVVIGVFCCVFVVCIQVYIFAWLCRTTYSAVPGIYFDAWCIAWCSKWKETLETYRVIASTLMLGVSHAIEVFVLGLLVYKIPYSSCILIQQS